jgi:hypothetical protein
MLCKESENALELHITGTCMLDEFIRYCALQRDQAPLAILLIYLKRKGGYVQLNQIWRENGPTGGGPFWNQTTLINKLDKLERLEIITMERRILPSPRDEAKKKTNTFYRISPATPLYPYIFGMLKIYREVPDKYSSELVEKPLDHLCDLAGRCASSDPLVGRELDVAMELIGEVFSVGGDEVRRMIKERMERKGMIRDRRKELPGNVPENARKEPKDAAIKAKSPSRKRKPTKPRPVEE